MKAIIIKARARLDILQMWLRIAEDNLPAAIRVEKELETEVRDLAAMPGKGYRRRGIKDRRTRCWPFYSFLIFYKYDEKYLTVVRVLHGRRNIGKVIRKR